MAYGKWNILREETFNEFGYYPEELTKGTKKVVKCKCEACGIVSTKRFREADRKHVCKSVINGKKKCFKCKEFLLVEEFSKNRSTFDGYQKVCKECFSQYNSVKKGYNKKSDLIKKDIAVYFKHKVYSITSRLKKKNLSINIDGEYLIDLYNQQKGLCYYSQIPIVHNENVLNHDSISVDRLNPDLGYIKGNVVLCSFAMNSFKNMMNEEEFKEYLKIILPNLKKYSEKNNSFFGSSNLFN